MAPAAHPGLVPASVESVSRAAVSRPGLGVTGMGRRRSASIASPMPSGRRAGSAARAASVRASSVGSRRESAIMSRPLGSFRPAASRSAVWSFIHVPAPPSRRATHSWARFM